MGFLGSLGAGAVDRRVLGHERLAKAGHNVGAGLLLRFPGDGCAVGAHVGDQADLHGAEIDALVKLLGDAHRAPGIEVQAAGRFLL